MSLEVGKVPFVVPLLMLYGLDAPLNTLEELETLFTDELADTADVADLGDVADVVDFADVMDVADDVDACKFADVADVLGVDDESDEAGIAVEKFGNEEGAVDPQLHCALVDDPPARKLEIEKNRSFDFSYKMKMYFKDI